MEKTSILLSGDSIMLSDKLIHQTRTVPESVAEHNYKIEGYEAYFVGKKFPDCTYRHVPKLFKQWKEGWMIAYAEDKQRK